jgi:membrane protease YdiL (CAAX protease family)
VKPLFYALPPLIVAWTAWGVFDYQKLKAALRAGDRNPLRREYQLTVIGEIAGGLLALGAVGSSIFEPDDDFRITLSGFAIELMAGGIIGLVAPLVVTPLLARAGRRQPVVGDVEALIPRTGSERRWYAAVAVSAGVCEELVFRGYGLRLLHSVGLTSVPLIVACALAFGLVHVYQGISGVVITGLLGAFLTVIYIWTGSLLPAMAAHILVDLRILMLPAPAEEAKDRS